MRAGPFVLPPCQIAAMEIPPPPPAVPRPDAALRAEIERVRRMTIKERVIAALTKRERFA